MLQKNQSKTCKLSPNKKQWCSTFLRETTQNRPRKLTRKRKRIIHDSCGFLKLLESGLSDCLATRSLIPNRSQDTYYA